MSTHPAWSIRGQAAAVESTIALIAGLVLLFGSLKLCLWFTQRYVSRLRGYDCTRLVATGDTRLIPWDALETLPPRLWDGPSKKLNIFGEIAIDSAPNTPLACPPFGTAYDGL